MLTHGLQEFLLGSDAPFARLCNGLGLPRLGIRSRKQKKSLPIKKPLSRARTASASCNSDFSSGTTGNHSPTKTALFASRPARYPAGHVSKQSPKSIQSIPVWHFQGLPTEKNQMIFTNSPPIIWFSRATAFRCATKSYVLHSGTVWFGTSPGAAGHSCVLAQR